MILSGWKAVLVALIGGAMLPLAFAPFDWWPVALLSLMLLLAVTRHGETTAVLWRGLVFGIGYFGVGVSWVYISISLFGNATALLAMAITALFVLAYAAYIVFAVFLIRQFSLQGVTSILIVPSVWVLVEWVRGWMFTGFGWLDVGYAFIDTPLAAYAPYVGVLGLSFLVVLTASACLYLLNLQANVASRASALLLLIGIWLIPVFIAFPNQTYVDKKAISVALLQGNIPQHRKWLTSERQSTLDLYRRMAELHWDKQLIVWPETAVPAFEDEVFDYLESLHIAAQLNDSQIMLGIPVRESHGDRYYNALTVLGNADRGADSLYQKRHLVPFGEYLPFRFLLGPLLDFLEIPMSNFSASELNKPVVKAGKTHAGAFICFEISFADEVRQALPEADYLVNISNDAWFGDSLAPYQHLQMARMRALENGRYLLRATNTGITAIIDSSGGLQTALKPFRADVLTGVVQPMSGSTVYSRYGDYPLLISIALFLLLMWRFNRS